MTFVADSPAPPVQPNTIGLNVLFSTLIIPDSNLFSVSVLRTLYASLIPFGHDMSGGLKVFLIIKRSSAKT